MKAVWKSVRVRVRTPTDAAPIVGHSLRHSFSKLLPRCSRHRVQRLDGHTVDRTTTYSEVALLDLADDHDWGHDRRVEALQHDGLVVVDWHRAGRGRDRQRIQRRVRVPNLRRRLRLFPTVIGRRASWIDSIDDEAVPGSSSG